MVQAVAKPVPSDGGQLNTLPKAKQCSFMLGKTQPPQRYSTILDWQWLRARLRWVSMGTQTKANWVLGEQDPVSSAQTLLQEPFASSGLDLRMELAGAESDKQIVWGLCEEQFDPLSWMLKEFGSRYSLGSAHLTSLAFANDLALVSSSWEGMATNLGIVERIGPGEAEKYLGICIDPWKSILKLEMIDQLQT
ncbi:reverse transcriptase [Arapaima gigas]